MIVKMSIKSSYESIYFLIMILYMAMATPYTQVLNFPPYKAVWSFFIPVILTVILIARKYYLFRITRTNVFCFLIIFVWIIFHYFKYGQVYPMTLFLIYNVIMAYIFVTVFGYKIFVLYEQYVSLLALISIVLWSLYQVTPIIWDNIYSIFSVIDGSDTSRSNILIFGVANSSDILGTRNLGFAQEPGFFSVFLIIAIYFNLVLNRFSLSGNNNFYVLVLALVTTQSTTGYLSLLPIIFLYFFQKSVFTKTFIIFLMICAVPLIASLPFIGEKISTYMYSEDSIETATMSSDYQSTINSVYVPQRIDGLVFEWFNFMNDPVLGYGTEFNRNSFVGNFIGDAIVVSNGNVKIFSKFGFIIGILFLLGVYKTGKLLHPFYPVLGGICFLFTFLVIGFSYDIIHIPLLLSIWIFSFLKPERVVSKRNYIKCVADILTKPSTKKMTYEIGK